MRIVNRFTFIFSRQRINILQDLQSVLKEITFERAHED